MNTQIGCDFKWRIFNRMEGSLILKAEENSKNWEYNIHIFGAMEVVGSIQ